MGKHYSLRVDKAGLEFVIDGGGAAIAAGEKGHLVCPCDGVIASAELEANQPGDIRVDIWKSTYDDFPPTDADSICGGNEPAISSGQKYKDETLTGWTKSLNEGDILAFNVDSCSTITRVTITLRINKT